MEEQDLFYFLSQMQQNAKEQQTPSVSVLRFQTIERIARIRQIFDDQIYQIQERFDSYYNQWVIEISCYVFCSHITPLREAFLLADSFTMETENNGKIQLTLTLFDAAFS